MGRTTRFEERVQSALALQEASEAGAARRVRAVGLTAGVINANKRRYSLPVLQAAVAELSSHLHESAGQGRLVATGEAEHPRDKGGRPSLLETVVKWEQATIHEGQVLLEGVILPTAKGRDILTLIEHGVPVGVSMRGYGQAKPMAESVQEVTALTITGFDLVAEPSDPFARLTESKEQVEDTMDEQEKLQLELAESKRALAEQAQALTEAKRAQDELVALKASQAVETAITEAAKGLRYGDQLNKLFVESVRAAAPGDAAAVQALVEAKRKEFDSIVAAAQLKAMGKVDVTGPVFEAETGRPAFSRAAFEITESLVAHNLGERYDLVKRTDPASRYAKIYLERFDEKFKGQLIAEAKAFEEASTTSDMNLPYSVMRAVVEQVWPEVVAANVFDFGMATQAPERLYFETYAGESGTSAVAVTDEVVTGDHGVWVELANNRLNPGSVVLTNSGASTTYTEGTDYVIDYALGNLKTLAAGATTDGQSLKIDYTYEAIRRGENTAIKGAKNTLAYITMEIAADRLSTYITNENVVFSRSQLGYDVVGRTLANLIRKIRTKIDKDIFYRAVAASAEQASNSGGTWTAASDAVALLVQYIGLAKAKVANRYYTPTSIVMSTTNSERLSNWEGFDRTGFTNAFLGAAGFAGGVKGLPVFHTPVMSDAYVLVTNRELVAQRTFQPMALKGPFPVYSSGELVAAEQWYVEEFNGTEVPVVEKVSHVKVA
jgi:regulator of replication initiation timing